MSVATANSFLNGMKQSVELLRQKKPLVLNLTNFVTMDLIANMLLALGAAPLMSESKDEAEELITISSVLAINIGTLDQDFVTRAKYYAKLARAGQKPIVLDPVGVGASRLRQHAALEIFPYVDLLRGNASEINGLAKALGLLPKAVKTEPVELSKGVETSMAVADATMAAKLLASWHDHTGKISGKILGKIHRLVAVTGKVDYFTDGVIEKHIAGGSELMPLVTGMGCGLSAVLAGFLALAEHDKQKTQLVEHGLWFYGLTGMAAAAHAHAPASFRNKFIDSLFQPNWSELADCYHHLSKTIAPMMAKTMHD